MDAELAGFSLTDLVVSAHPSDELTVSRTSERPVAEGDHPPAVRGLDPFMPVAGQTPARVHRLGPGFAFVPAEAHHAAVGVAVFAHEQAKLVSVVGAQNERLAEVFLVGRSHDARLAPREPTVRRDSHPDRLVVLGAVGFHFRVLAYLAEQGGRSVLQADQPRRRHSGGKIGRFHLAPGFPLVLAHHRAEFSAFAAEDEEPLGLPVRRNDPLERRAVAVGFGVNFRKDFILTDPGFAAIGGLGHRSARAAVLEGPDAEEGLAVVEEQGGRVALINLGRALCDDGLTPRVPRNVHDRKLVFRRRLIFVAQSGRNHAAKEQKHGENPSKYEMVGHKMPHS